MKIEGPDGKMMEVDVVDVVESSEPWSVYKLQDGTELRVKFVLGVVYRARGVLSKEGEPMYVARSQNVVVAVVPDHLKGEGKQGKKAAKRS
jgi:hypothetical protein